MLSPPHQPTNHLNFSPLLLCLLSVFFRFFFSSELSITASVAPEARLCTTCRAQIRVTHVYMYLPSMRTKKEAHVYVGPMQETNETKGNTGKNLRSMHVQPPAEPHILPPLIPIGRPMG
ncbi:hypothetical protein B0T09DRAFT_329078 [Sordaria sp. MPI-SDFR-AT-0083]|nr:hypothetical protein B0T09DRAFT_329078 [Sordaria sp. MPI-SDFR-AT-0083]